MSRTRSKQARGPAQAASTQMQGTFLRLAFASTQAVPALPVGLPTATSVGRAVVSEACTQAVANVP